MREENTPSHTSSTSICTPRAVKCQCLQHTSFMPSCQGLCLHHAPRKLGLGELLNMALPITGKAQHDRVPLNLQTALPVMSFSSTGQFGQAWQE